jgi:hypothetical protein
MQRVAKCNREVCSATQGWKARSGARLDDQAPEKSLYELCSTDKGRQRASSEVLDDSCPSNTIGGICIKLGINSFRKCGGVVLHPQILSQDLCCCASFAHRLGRQTFGGSTGTGEKATQDDCRLEDRLHPPLGQGVEMPDEFERTQLTLFLPPEVGTPLGTERIIEHNEEHTAREIA